MEPLSEPSSDHTQSSTAHHPASNTSSFKTLIRQRWPEYVLEVVVIIVSITLSFAVDEWKKAIKKVETMVIKIGYPDQVPNRSLRFAADNYLANYHAVFAQGRHNYLHSIGRAKDRTAWRRPLWSTAGSYEPDYNSFIIVAGLLSPPFFFANANDAVNYGAIGSLIGHELSHSLDIIGKDYDEHGVRRPWWTNQDSLVFKQKISPLIEQYNRYKVLDSLAINGNKTLGENIADLSGLQLAYEAFQQTPYYKQNQPLAGLSPSQQFFLAFAQQWRSTYTDKVLKDYFLEDVHPPDNIRVNGTLSNLPAFYQAFRLKPMDTLYREEASRVSIW